MRKLISLVAVCCAIISSASASEVVPSDLTLQSGTYRTKWVIPADDGAPRTFTGKAKLQDGLSKTSKRAPKFISAHPLYGSLELEALVRDEIDDGGEKLVTWGYETIGHILFALDESKGDGKGYDAIYVDANRDNSLGDERMVSARMINGELAFCGVANIPHAKAHPGSENPNRLTIDVFFATDKDMTDGDIYYRGAWAGEIPSNKGGILFMLVDYNNSGFYNNHFVSDQFSGEPGDYVLCDCAKSGRLPDFCDSGMRLQSVMNIGGKLYVPKTSALGDQIEIQPYQGKSGKVRLQITAISGMSIKACQSGMFINSRRTQEYVLPADGTSITVPAKSYDPMAVHLGLVDASGKELGAIYGHTDSVIVRPDETTVISIGGQPRIAIEPWIDQLEIFRAERNLVDIYMLLEHGTLTLDPRDVEGRPTVTVTDASGKVVHVARADHAAGLSTAFEIGLPTDLKLGKYTLSVSWQTSPFGPMYDQREMVIR